MLRVNDRGKDRESKLVCVWIAIKAHMHLAEITRTLLKLDQASIAVGGREHIRKNKGHVRVSWSIT